MYIVTTFIGEKGYKKTPQLTDAQSPSATSKDDSADVSNDIIRKTNKNFNPKTDNRKSLTVDREGNTLSDAATRAGQVVQSKILSRDLISAFLYFATT